MPYVMVFKWQMEILALCINNIGYNSSPYSLPFYGIFFFSIKSKNSKYSVSQSSLLLGCMQWSGTMGPEKYLEDISMSNCSSLKYKKKAMGEKPISSVLVMDLGVVSGYCWVCLELSHSGSLCGL